MDSSNLKYISESSQSSVLHSSSLPWRNARRIQRLTEGQHFHYPVVEIGPVQVRIISLHEGEEWKFELEVRSNEESWNILRSLSEISNFDRQLHRCVFERRHSKLEEFDFTENMSGDEVQEALRRYMQRLSQLTGSIITCYPVLKFLEIDCRGNHFEPAEETAVNTPAIAAAVVTREFIPTEKEQLKLKIGDILSIIEMNSSNTDGITYWKAKLTISNNRITQDFNSRMVEVGYFPSDCVRLIDDKRLPSQLTSHRKLTMITARRMSEIIRKRVRRKEPIFGVDLVNHLERTERKVPLILQRCCEAIEMQGIVTGIYRQCGIQSNIQRLRAKFDSGNEPDLYEFGQRDIYSVSSLLKQYFRQLPNPLFTFQSYSKILTAFESAEELRCDKLKRVLETMPAAHYRTASYLLKHLSRLCNHTKLTDMTAKNLAIVWAPNLFRAPPLLDGADSHLLNGLNIHTSLCNYLIMHANDIFGEEDNDDESVLTSNTAYSESHQSSPVSDRPGLIKKSATFSDMRANHECRWPRFLRGKSVEGFWKFGRPTSNGSMGSSITGDSIKWKRSHSTDTSLPMSRTDSIISFMSRGMGELREGVRSLRDRARVRARSLRPSFRPPLSPGVRLRNYSQIPHSPLFRKEESKTSRNIQVIQESLTTSVISNYSEESYYGNKIYSTPQPARKENNSATMDDTINQCGEFELKEKRVMFKQEEIDIDEPSSSHENNPLYDRSSPVEEWSSDSTESPHLEMSRYDNVSPSGTMTKVHHERFSVRSLSTPMPFYQDSKAKKLFLK